MEEIGFLGAFDKKDLLLDIGKVLTTLNKKVLIVDATFLQRSKYIIPNVSQNGSVTYISEYQGCDVAVGFMNFNQIMQYLGTSNLNYDYVFVDSDNIQTTYSFLIPNYKKIYFITSYDRYEVMKAKEFFNMMNLKNKIKIKKVIYSTNVTDEQAKYLDKTLENNNTEFDEDEIVFFDNDVDRVVILENQLLNTISFKHSTKTFKNSLSQLITDITDKTISNGNVQSAMKIII